jgi:hypothetical protein
MVLARAWRRRLYASLGLSVVVPAALLLSVALLALNAGFPGLSALGQALSGPSVSATQAPVLGAAATGSRAGGGIPTAGLAGTPGAVAGGTPAVRRGGTPAAGATPGHGTTAPGVSTPHGTGGVGVGSGGGGWRTGSTSGAGGGPGSPPAQTHHHVGNPPSSPLSPVIRTVTTVTSRLPAPVGPAATGVAKSAGTTVGKIVHRLPSAAGSALHGAHAIVKGAASIVKGVLSSRQTAPARRGWAHLR